MAAVPCSACGTPNPAGARFCNTCGARLEAALAGHESRRTVTIVFVDVAGSTALGEQLDPESLRALMGEFFDLARGVVERHGGIVEKFIGDAVMAVFGLPTIHEDDALRAVRAAEELRSRLAASHLAGRLAIRTGINTGKVVAGDPDAGQRLVTGDAVNTAARLEQAAQPGEILLGLPTLRLVRGAVVTEEVPAIDARGKADPLRAFRLSSVDAAAELAARRSDVPLVGRERELARLRRSYEDAVAERRCGLFTLLGPAGVGKSRLVHELTAAVRGEATVLRGRALPYGEGITFWPIAEMVRGAAGVDETDDHEAAVAKLRALVADVPEADEIVRSVATAVGIADGEIDRDDLFRAVRRLFETLASKRPLVAVFDDLQWAEPTLIDLVEHVIDWSSGSPILVVVLARPELLDLRPTWGGGKLDAQTVLLEGLGEGDVRDLARALLGGDVDDALLDRVEAVAEGNPLFVEQLVAMLVEDGHLVRDGDRWQARLEFGEIEVPPTISALLAARLDRLPSGERALAARASVVGRVFERLAVAELSPETDRADVSAGLHSLVRRELIRPDRSAEAPDTFRFRHILIRDAAYDALPKRERAELHARFADWLESTTGGRLAEFEEIVGYHLDQAVRYREELGLEDEGTLALRRRAVARLAEAGTRASDRSDLHAAVRLLGRATELARGTEIDVLETLLELGTTFLDLARYADAERTLSEAEATARRVGDRARAARAEILSLVTRLQQDPTVLGEDVEALANRHEATLEAARYGRGLVDLWIARGLVGLTQSRWAASTIAHERALVEAERVGAVGLTDLIYSWLANALVWGPTPAEDGIARCRELVDKARSRRAKASILARMSILIAYAGRPDEARRGLIDARATMADLGIAPVMLGGNLGAAEIEFAAGDYDRAAELLFAGRDYLAAAGETGVRSTVEGLLALALARLGRDSEAIEVSHESEAHAAADDMASQMAFRAGRALASAHLGRLDDALELSAEALEIAARTDQMNEVAQVAEVHAEVLMAAGRGDEAKAALETAIEGYERKGNVLASERARHALAAGW
jgi:class 3 adenylate cyclase/tetratricopeptide (TPR) repeat protein